MNHLTCPVKHMFWFRGLIDCFTAQGTTCQECVQQGYVRSHLRCGIDLVMTWWHQTLIWVPVKLACLTKIWHVIRNSIRCKSNQNCTVLLQFAVFLLTHNRCEVVISWWSPLLPKISIYATKCECILEKSGIFIHLQSKYCINLSCKKNLTISWVQIAARW